MREGADIVQAARRCATRLDALGHRSWSQKITDAIDAASTGGELVMALRWQLQSLQREGLELPKDVDAEVMEILRAIEATRG